MSTDATSVELAARDAFYPDAPPRDDVQNSIYLHERSVIATLINRFGDPGATLAVSRALLGPSLSEPDDTRIPDLMVAFNCDRAQAIKDNGYCLANQPHPPQFVLEIAPPAGGILRAGAGVARHQRDSPARRRHIGLRRKARRL